MTIIKRHSIRKFIAAAVCMLAPAMMYASTPNSLYFMHELPYKMYMNPALQPDSLFATYVELPVISTINFGINTGGVSMQDVLQPGADGQLVSVLSPNFPDRDGLYNSLNDPTKLKVDFSTSLFGFGFRLREKGYLSFNLSLKTNFEFGVPKGLFQLFFYGTPNAESDNEINLTSLSANANVYLDFSGGYSRRIGEKWKVGGRIHVLTGLATLNANFDDLRLNASTSQWSVTNVSNIYYSLAGLKVNLNEEGQISGLQDFDISNAISAIGAGVSFDVGGEFKPIKDLSVSVSLADLGFLYYKGNRLYSNTTGSFTGLTVDNFDEMSLNAIDSLTQIITDATVFEQEERGFANMLNAKLYVAAEYTFLKDKMSVGFLSKTEFNKRFVDQEFTLAYTIRPCRFFGIMASYSFMSSDFDTIGLGVTVNIPGISIYVVSDYMPLYYSAEGIPYRSSAFNLQAGLVMTFGGRWSRKSKKAKAEKVEQVEQVEVMPTETAVSK